jgi:hypothetical protein
MQIVRTIVWVLLLTALLVFSFANWDPTITVKIWTNLVVETKLPAIVVISFLIGFVPMWLLYRATKWQLTRRIGSLEATSRAAAQIPLPATSETDRVVTPAEHPGAAPDRDPPRGL